MLSLPAGSPSTEGKGERGWAKDVCSHQLRATFSCIPLQKINVPLFCLQGRADHETMCARKGRDRVEALPWALGKKRQIANKQTNRVPDMSRQTKKNRETAKGRYFVAFCPLFLYFCFRFLVFSSPFLPFPFSHTLLHTTITTTNISYPITEKA